MRPNELDRVRVVGLLAVGLDGTDGHRRITRSEDFLVLGGSAETHERMQETAIRFEEALAKRGKTLAATEIAEVLDLLDEAREARS
ncbi:MAG TPA: hypothetical protein VKE40_08410 [Gemmataceae bacterium]|nr:hypothetical protein [Gemmataceae bacterium]